MTTAEPPHRHRVLCFAVPIPPAEITANRVHGQHWGQKEIREEANKYALVVRQRAREALERSGFSKPFGRVHLELQWVVLSFQRDYDNQLRGFKKAQDALVAEGIIPNDSMRWIVKVTLTRRRRKKKLGALPYDYLVVTLSEVDE